MSFETCASAGTSPSIATACTGTATDQSLAMAEAAICYIVRKSSGYELRLSDSSVLTASARDFRRSRLLSGAQQDAEDSGLDEPFVTAKHDDIRLWLQFLQHSRRCELDESDLSRMIMVRGFFRRLAPLYVYRRVFWT